jgi:P-type E1-E2 ATPase
VTITNTASNLSGANALEELLKIGATNASVLRSGKWQDVDISLLVPGDIVAIGTGDKVPADLRVLEVLRIRLP